MKSIAVAIIDIYFNEFLCKCSDGYHSEMISNPVFGQKAGWFCDSREAITMTFIRFGFSRSGENVLLSWCSFEFDLLNRNGR